MRRSPDALVIIGQQNAHPLEARMSRFWTGGRPRRKIFSHTLNGLLDLTGTRQDLSEPLRQIRVMADIAVKDGCRCR